VSVVDENGVTNSSVAFAQNGATFKYGRIKVSNISTYLTDANTTFNYEYWTQNGWELNGDHNATFGDVNLTKSVYNNLNIIKHSNENGKEKMEFQLINANPPKSIKVHLAVPSWLWYHPLANEYEDPSSSNLNCLTHPCMKVDFLKNGNAWGGINSTSQKYNASNRTSNIAPKNSDINASKSQVKSINW
jgi:hypothetical protein